MEAAAMSLSFLANEGAINVPYFQRPYVWNKTNWEELLKDLLDSKKQHFLGSLILKQLPKQSGQPKESLIIDGQQRLTTLSILLIAIYNSFDEKTKSSTEQYIKSNLFYKRRATDELSQVKINHSRIDANDYKRVIKNELTISQMDLIKIDDVGSKEKSNSSKILQCSKYFSNELKKLDSSSKLDLFDRLVDIENKILVVIDLFDEDNEQAIFDTINSAGVRLTATDIIKNAIFQKAMALFPSQEDVNNLYEEFWETTFLMNPEIVKFWEAERTTGRLIRDNSEILFHAIAVIKRFFAPDQHTLSDLATLYKSHLKTLDSNGLIDFLKEICQYAEIYRTEFLQLGRSKLYYYGDQYSRLFHILYTLDISTFHPLILQLFYKYKDNETDLLLYLGRLESFIIRKVISKQETKSFNKLCVEFILNIDKLEESLLECGDDKVLDGLLDISNKHSSLVLFWIELYRRHMDKWQSLKELKYDYSLEHIMPQKWEEYWQDVPVLDTNNNPITVLETAKQNRENRIYHIGNMTLLNTYLNTSLRNYAFEKKIEGEGKKKGIRHYGELLITKVDIIDEFDNGMKIWDESTIQKRTSNLFKEFIAIW